LGQEETRTAITFDGWQPTQRSRRRDKKTRAILHHPA
jgi:hypothetical protein